MSDSSFDKSGVRHQNFWKTWGPVTLPPPSCYIVHTNVSQMWIRGVVERLLNAAHSWQTTCYLLLTRASTDESGEFTPRHLLTFHTGGANIFVSHVGRSLSYQAEFANCGAPALRKKTFLSSANFVYIRPTMESNSLGLASLFCEQFINLNWTLFPQIADHILHNF